MAKDKASSWRDRLQGWTNKAESTLQDLRESEYAEQLTNAGRQASEQARAWAEQVGQSPYAEQLSNVGRQASAQARTWAEQVGQKSAPLWTETTRAAERIRSTEAWQAIEERAQGMSEGTRNAAKETGQRLEHIQKEAKLLLTALEDAVQAADDRETVLNAATIVFERAGAHVDLHSDAIAVGSIREAGVGLAALQGSELYFVPPDGPVRAQLRVNRIVGQAARLAVGGQLGAYVASFYGSRDLVARPLDRKGADLGLIALSLGFFQATAREVQDHHAAGWLLELAAGAAFGIPILSDLSAFELEEVTLATYSLEPSESAPIEEALARAPDLALRRKVARLLVRDLEAKPS